MEHLKATEKFIVYKKGESLPLYVSKLVSWVERMIFNRISKRVNWILDRQKDDTFEITKSTQAIDTDGNWRFNINGDDFEVQRNVSGTWTTVYIFKGS